MSDKTENKIEQDEKARRAFLKKAGKLAAAVPVATLLVSASSKKAAAIVEELPPSTGGSLFQGSTQN